jgi:hypothetical protein
MDPLCNPEYKALSDKMMVNNELNHIKGRQHGLNKNSAIGISFEEVRNSTEILS